MRVNLIILSFVIAFAKPSTGLASNSTQLLCLVLVDDNKSACCCREAYRKAGTLGRLAVNGL